MTINLSFGKTDATSLPSGSQVAWPSVQVFVSSPSIPAAASTFIRNLVVAPLASLPVSYYPSASYPSGFALVANNLLGYVALPAAYMVSFDLNPTAYPGVNPSTSIIRLTAGNGYASTAADRLPAVFVCNTADFAHLGCVNGGIHSAYQNTLNGGGVYFMTGQTLPLNAWSTVTLTIDDVSKVFTSGVSGAVTIPTQSASFPTPPQTTWPSVQVYASDIFQAAATASIRNLAISEMTAAPTPQPTALPTSIPSQQPTADPTMKSDAPTPFPTAQPTLHMPLLVTYYPSSSYPNGFTLVQGNLVGVVALPAQYTVIFDVMPTAETRGGWRSIVHLTATGGDWPSGAGSRLPAVMLPSMTVMYYASAVDNPFGTHTALDPYDKIPLNQWSTVKITIDAINLIMTMEASGALTTQTLSRMLSTPQHQTWPSVQVYASDPWYDAAAANIRNLAIAEISAAAVPQPTSLPSPLSEVAPAPLPTGHPTRQPTGQPTRYPTTPTGQPSRQPTGHPTWNPTSTPTVFPSVASTHSPSAFPTAQPPMPSPLPITYYPSITFPSGFTLVKGNLVCVVSLPAQYSVSFDLFPTADGVQPTRRPTSIPTAIPSRRPSAGPSTPPTRPPTAMPTKAPSASPTTRPTANPTAVPTAGPTMAVVAPTAIPTASPTAPSAAPSAIPTPATPTALPSVAPSLRPTVEPTARPTLAPSASPIAVPTLEPTESPSAVPVWLSIIHLTASGTDQAGAGPRLPAVFFCESGCQTLGLHVSFLSGTSDYQYYSTQSLPSNTWSTITIGIDSVSRVMTVEASGGVTIPAQKVSISTPTQQTWPSVQVYASDPWHEAAVAKIRNLAIAIAPPAALPISYYPSSSYPNGFALVKGNLVGVVSLPAQYTVSFDLMPTADGTDYRSIIHLTGNGQNTGSGSRLPALYFCNIGDCAGNSLGLVLSFVASGTGLLNERALKTTNLRLNQWSSVTIVVDNAFQIVTMSLNALTGVTFLPDITATTTSFPTPEQTTWPSVQVYASDSQYSAASANIRNLVIVSPDSLPISYYPSSSYPNGFALVKGNLVGVVALPAQYTASFDLMPTADGTDWRNIIHLTASGTNTGAGSRLPGVWFCQSGFCPTLGIMAYHMGVTSETSDLGRTGIHFSTIQALPLNQWSSVTITTDSTNLIMTMSVSGGLNAPTQTIGFPVPEQIAWPSVQVYASDPWHASADASIRNLAIAEISAAPMPQPSGDPTPVPTVMPSPAPTTVKTDLPTIKAGDPTPVPTSAPSPFPTSAPSADLRPTAVPSPRPTYAEWDPTPAPSPAPTSIPTAAPTAEQTSHSPTDSPTQAPSVSPTTHKPTASPTASPTDTPTKDPTVSPTASPTYAPSASPTPAPSTEPTFSPSVLPTTQPTFSPSAAPTPAPSTVPTPLPSPLPSALPSFRPGSPTPRPTQPPTGEPTGKPSRQPSRQPSSQPSSFPTRPSGQPTARPSQPTGMPSGQPTRQPSRRPTGQPSRQPSSQPTQQPSRQPTSQPTRQPSRQPSGQPTCQPISRPTRQPSRQPSAQPSRQPFSRPSSHPTGQPSGSPTSQPAVQPCPAGSFIKSNKLGCKPCEKGWYSPRPNADFCLQCPAGSFATARGSSSCTPASSGSFTTSIGSTSQQQCPAGSFSSSLGSTTCQPCKAGWANIVEGATVCTICAQGFFSTSEGSLQCTQCSNGWITPLAGSTSASQCLSPQNNFIMAFVCLGVVVFVVVVYVVNGNFIFAAFLRKERVIMKQVGIYHSFILSIEKSEADIRAAFTRKKVLKKIRQLMGKEAAEGDHSTYAIIKEVVKTLVFGVLSSFLLMFAGLLTFAVLLAQVLFQALIIYKQSQTLFPNLVSFSDALNLALDAILEALGGLPPFLLGSLRILCGWVCFLFLFLSRFKIDLSGIGVTCQGASSPFELGLDIFILGTVIIVIESELQTFRGLCFASALSKYVSRLLSREYVTITTTRSPPMHSFELILWYLSYFGRLVFVSLVQILFFAIDFKSALQFVMSLVQIQVFAQDNGRHSFSPNCNQVAGYANFDTYLAYASTFFAYALILPVVYEVAKILCPLEQVIEHKPAGVDGSKNRMVDDMSEFMGSSATPSNPGHAQQQHQHDDKKKIKAIEKKQQGGLLPTGKERSDEPRGRRRRIIDLFTSLPISGWLRLPVTILSPDLLLAHLTEGLVLVLKDKDKDKDKGGQKKEADGVEGGGGSDNEKNTRRSTVLASALVKAYRDDDEEQREGGTGRHFVHAALYGLLSQILVPLQKYPLEGEEARWLKERQELLMPSYYELIQVEVFYLFGRWKYLKPGRATGYPLLGHLLSVLLLLFPIGHLFTSVGQWAVGRVLRKYKTFILVSLGYWTDRAAEAYDIQRKVEVIAEGRDRDDVSIKTKEQEDAALEQRDGDEDFARYSACLSATVATRAILLQIVPILTIWSIFSIATSGCPLFVVSGTALDSKIAPYFVWDCFDRAEEAEKGSKYGKLRWLRALSGASIFVLESRMINFLVQSYMVALSITLLYNPSSRMLVASAVAVLLPIALARSLRLVVVLGKAMNVKDANSLWAGDDTSTADEKQIRSLVKAGTMSKEQIVAEVERRQQQEKQDIRRKRQSKRRRLHLERQGIDEEELELADLGSSTRAQITAAENPMRPALAKPRGSEGQSTSSDAADVEGRASASGARPSTRPSVFALFRDSIPFASMLGGDEPVSTSLPPPIAPPATRPSTHIHVHHNASDTVGVNPNALSPHPGHRLKFSTGHTAVPSLPSGALAGPLPSPTAPTSRPVGATPMQTTPQPMPKPGQAGPLLVRPMPPNAFSAPPPLRLVAAAPVAPTGSLLPTIARLPVTPPVPPTRPSPPKPQSPHDGPAPSPGN